MVLGHVVMNKRKRVIALEPHGKGMLGTALYYPNEVRNADDHFEEIPEVKMPAEILKLAEHTLDSKARGFDPDEFEDRYKDALVELIRGRSRRLQPRAAQSRPRSAPHSWIRPALAPTGSEMLCSKSTSIN